MIFFLKVHTINNFAILFWILCIMKEVFFMYSVKGKQVSCKSAVFARLVSYIMGSKALSSYKEMSCGKPIVVD